MKAETLRVLNHISKNGSFAKDSPQSKCVCGGGGFHTRTRFSNDIWQAKVNGFWLGYVSNLRELGFKVALLILGKMFTLNTNPRWRFVTKGVCNISIWRRKHAFMLKNGGTILKLNSSCQGKTIYNPYISKHLGVLWFVFIFPNFYRLHLNNKTCVASTNCKHPFIP